MRKERKNIALSGIVLNEGQLDWLPKNPRQWTQTDLDRTAASIAEDTDFLEDRPLLVVPFMKSYIVFAGNLRRLGAEKAMLETVPCVVYHPETDEDRQTIMRRAMKDNGSFGQTDWDEIFSTEWGNLPLSDWGLTPPGWEDKETAGDGKDKEEQEGKPKNSVIMVEVPDKFRDRREAILAALIVTLAEWPGCIVS